MTAAPRQIITEDGTTLFISCPEGTSKGFDFENVLDQIETDLSGLYWSTLFSLNLARLHGHGEAARILDGYLKDVAQILDHIVHTKHCQPPEASDVDRAHSVGCVCESDFSSSRQGNEEAHP